MTIFQRKFVGCFIAMDGLIKYVTEMFSKHQKLGTHLRYVRNGFVPSDQVIMRWSFFFEIIYERNLDFSILV